MNQGQAWAWIISWAPLALAAPSDVSADSGIQGEKSDSVKSSQICVWIFTGGIHSQVAYYT